MVNVLIVDDFSTNAVIIKKIMPAEKYNVKTVSSGAQALSYLDSQKKTDIILLDLNMPDMDGLETLKRIRQREAYKIVPVIFVSGVADRERVLEGFKYGVDDVIAKPVDAKLLLERVERALVGEAPVQLYKRKHGSEQGIDKLYDNLAKEFSDSSFSPDLMSVLNGIDSREAEKHDDDSNTKKNNEDFGVDFSGLLDQNLW